MRVLAVHAHPVPESYGRALFEAAVETLRAGGHEVDALDLYAEGFAPAMDADERRRHNVPGPNRRGLEPDIARLERTEALVLVYPTWWFGMPAMLKGWFDRVWMPGVAFDLDAETITPRLTRIRKLTVITTYGSPWWVVNLWLMRADRRIVAGFRRLLHPNCTQEWLALYRLDTATDAARSAFLERVRRSLARL
ncbi:MAG: NAD(P)H-dependent oxidoreductase [Alphaproteobacteria bacterium]|nr:NAD(P)H-dependent oxidoreductase [Alphaproteobacteria bacterium]